uniref:polysaccharide biosynthesis/export family protein n=1 Tax=Sphingomonas sp. TaxID=28214 RepID=UPI0025D7D35D|nr:polysaccharide biosynthesis/export family protein [Sphingomonas sp.]
MIAQAEPGRGAFSGGSWHLRRMARGAILAALAMPVVLAGCADKRGGSVPYDVKNFSNPDAPVALKTNDSYHIGPGDVLSVVVFRVPDMTGDVSVDMTGNFTMPLIGQVAAIGKTSDDLAKELAQRLGAKYLQNPEVRVAVKSATNQRVTIDGSVKQAGIYPIAGSTTLIQAIALAKGTDTDANPRRVVVFRTIGGQRQAASFDLTDIRRGAATDPEIFGNDIIVVDGNKARQNFRDALSAVPLLSLFRPF